ncbi:SRPBCC domain-containing protein [Streptomyces rimosus]|uniref:SRPBCC domain-containing protein n=1 Tax=Streptomyces rimosus TaxID=1927 RepID=UPI00067E1E69|nr:SRPBCC domain-containing protein [Streptomyces rimosus]
MAETLRYTIAVSAAPERVWETLPTPEGSGATLFGSRIESSFEIGSRVEFVGQDADGERIVQVYGEITEFEPCRRFGYVQRPGPAHNPGHAETSCRMTHVLTPRGDGTDLELIIDRWSEGNPAYEHAISSYPESGYLAGVKAHAKARMA